jgi:LysM repeat protein
MPKSLYFKPFVGFFLILFSASQIFAQPEVLARADSTIRAYIESHKGFAIAEMRRTGIPASVTLGQAICESRYGTSKVAMQAHNHFGIKCYDTWTGKRYFHKDDEMKNGVLVPSCFRYYTTDSASYSDHSDFLMSRPWYEKLFENESDDYMSWIRGLNKAGYANAKDYDERILKHINKYELYKLDEKGFSLKRNKVAQNGTKNGAKNPKKTDKNTDTPVFIQKDTLLQTKTNEEDGKVEDEENNVKTSTTNKKAPIFIAKDTLRQKEEVENVTDTRSERDNAPAKMQIENVEAQPEKVVSSEIDNAPAKMQVENVEVQPEKMAVSNEQKPKLQRFTVGKTENKPLATNTANTPTEPTSAPNKPAESSLFGETAKTEVPKKVETLPANSSPKPTAEVQKTLPKTHKITASETLFSISKKYNIQLSQLLALNNLTMQTPLKPGRVLKLTE